jgi:hypothetical protein
MKTLFNNSSLKKKAKLAGLLYLIIILCGMSSEIFVRSVLIVPGNAITTANNIMNNQFLFRLGFLSDLIMVICDIAIAALFYNLLKSVSKVIALLAAFFRLVQASIIGINLLNYFTPILLLSGSNYHDLISSDQLNAQIMLNLESFNIGYLISGVFFAFNCLIMGYLLYKSNLFPNFLGVFLMVACFGYLFNCITNFLFPNYIELSEMVVMVTALISEFTFCIWLLWYGVRKTADSSIATGDLAK